MKFRANFSIPLDDSFFRSPILQTRSIDPVASAGLSSSTLSHLH